MRSVCTKTAVAVAVATATFVQGCDEKKTDASARMSTGDAPELTSSDPAGGSPELDLGEDWAGPGRGPAGVAQSGAPIFSDPGPWAIVMGTFTSPGHELAAANMVTEVLRVAPDLESTRVRRTESGSMVIFGAYSGPDDPAARRDLEMVKTTTVNGRAIFSRAMLSRVVTPRTANERNPHALKSVRKVYPKVDPLYTLQVAVFSDFDSGELEPAEVRRKAEAYAAELRVQGQMAFFDHDSERSISVVTVGLFDRRAVDPQSGIYSPDVQALLQRFPAHLVNGEILNEPIDRFDPGRGTRVQTPRLVLVP